VANRNEKPGGVTVGEAAGQAADHGDAGAADPGEQGEGLEGPDDGGFAVVQGGQAAGPGRRAGFDD